MLNTDKIEAPLQTDSRYAQTAVFPMYRMDNLFP